MCLLVLAIASLSADLTTYDPVTGAIANGTDCKDGVCLASGSSMLQRASFQPRETQACNRCYERSGTIGCVSMGDTSVACPSCVVNPGSWHCPNGNCLGKICQNAPPTAPPTETIAPPTPLPQVCTTCYVRSGTTGCVAMVDTSLPCPSCLVNPHSWHCPNGNCLGRICQCCAPPTPPPTGTPAPPTPLPPTAAPTHSPTYYCGPQCYVPGTAGARWTHEEALIVKAKLSRLYDTCQAGQMANEWRALHPGQNIGTVVNRPAPLVLRLGFHDCLKYVDDTGGCDGCIQLDGTEKSLNGPWHQLQLNSSDIPPHNGLQDIVKILEEIYTNPNFPSGTPTLSQSLRSSGKSRADFWALATIVAVEYGIETNNGVCADPGFEMPDAYTPPSNRWDWAPFDGNGGVHCSQKQGKIGCRVEVLQPVTFMTGRRDCIPRGGYGYIADKVERHPDPQTNGRGTVEFFRRDFNFSGRETVAIMGAHTMGRPHQAISMMPYVWVKSGGQQFNNQYYRNMVGSRDWFWEHTSGLRHGCNPLGNASGQKPKARWVANTRLHFRNGGPTFWIQEKFICNPNCAWRFHSGLDECMLNAEMGLYKDFQVSDGIPYGCQGLETFNLNTWNRHWQPGTTFESHWSTINGQKAEPLCNFNTLAEPVDGTPLHEIIDDYANHQEHWIRDFIPTFKRMLSNGYEPGDLVVGPDQWTSVNCTRSFIKNSGRCPSRTEPDKSWTCQALSTPSPSSAPSSSSTLAPSPLPTLSPSPVPSPAPSLAPTLAPTLSPIPLSPTFGPLTQAPPTPVPRSEPGSSV